MSLTSRTNVVESPSPRASLIGRGRRATERERETERSNNGQSNIGQKRTSTSANIINSEPEVVIRDNFDAGILEAMHCLLKAHQYATELKVDAWNFAVEIDFLRQRGISANDLRWLVGSGWLDHAEETTTTGVDQRMFSHGGYLNFRAQSCFVLTDCGVDVAQSLSEQCHGQASAWKTHFNSEAGRFQVRQDKPQWFEDRQQLYLGDGLVKEFKLPSPNQIAILAVFEEEQWPPHVDDPLPMCPTVGPKERLRYTIKSLNKHQKARKIRFRGDGRGEGICWELWSQETGTKINGQC